MIENAMVESVLSAALVFFVMVVACCIADERRGLTLGQMFCVATSMAVATFTSLEIWNSALVTSLIDLGIAVILLSVTGGLVLKEES